MIDLAKHLPPSAGRPRVLVMDHQSAAALAKKADLSGPVAPRPGMPFKLPFDDGHFDAVAACNPHTGFWIGELVRVLRPGGRLMLFAPHESRMVYGWQQIMLHRGLIHIYTDAQPDGILVRGERPPKHAAPATRISAVAGREKAKLAHQFISPGSPELATIGQYVHLLVQQTPNKPIWELAPGEIPRWYAITITHTPGQRTAALAFGSLVRAVNFMQQAVMSGVLSGVNKVAKFSLDTARGWTFDLLVHPEMEQLDSPDYSAPTATIEIDYQTAIHGEG